MEKQAVLPDGSLLESDFNDGVLILTLNRPRRFNALSRDSLNARNLS